MAITIQHRRRHIDLRELAAKAAQFCYGHLTIAGAQALFALFSLLRGEQTEPDASHFLALGPKAREIVQIAGALNLRPSDRAMHGEAMPRNMLKDALISGRRTPLIMLRRQAVDGDNQVEVRDAPPFRGDLADGACNKLDLDAHSSEFGKQDSQFVVANQRFAADN